MRASTNNSTFDSGSNYGYSHITSSTNSSSVSILNNTSDTGIELINFASNASGKGTSGSIYLHNVNATSVRRFVTGLLTCYANGFLTNTVVSAEWQNTSNAMEAVRFLFGAGNVASGVFKVYGIAKS
jgi:hypothetical protein